MRAIRVPLALVAVALLSLSQAAFGQSPKKIVFVAGPRDHGVNFRVPIHLYEKDLTVLKYCLENSNVKGITTKLYVGQVPKDLNEIKDAAAIVLHTSADTSPKETHAVFPQNPTTDKQSYPPETQAWLNEFDGLVQRGLGLVVFHYTTWVDNPRGRIYFLDWIGGFFEYRPSFVKTADWDVKLENETHPVLRGVRPWTFNEEFYCKMHFSDDARRVPLLMATPAKGDAPPELVSWAIERKGGGRSFVDTGVHFPGNMANEEHRRVLLNAIVWAARMGVPAGGVKSKLPEDFGK